MPNRLSIQAEPNSSSEHRCRAAFTLLELAVVMAVLSVVAVAATSMLGSRESVSSLQSRQEAELLASAIRTARTVAIAEGTNVRLQALPRGAQIVGFRLVADASGLVQADHTFPTEISTTWSANELLFTPMGTSTQLLQVDVSGSRATWTATQTSATGQTSVTRTR